MTRAGRTALTEAIEDYLKVAYKLSSRGGSATVVRIAGALGVSAPSVTNMVKRLRRLGLAEHAPYGAVRLTTRGSRIALEIIRHHRLWELYLTRRLGLPLDRVHEEAERLEHVLSDEMEERLGKMLGNPSIDPHGDPIPPKRGALRSIPVDRKLSELRAGERGVVTHVSDRNAVQMRSLVALGLLPGAKLRMLRKPTAAGAFFVRVGAKRRAVGRTLAEGVRVAGS